MYIFIGALAAALFATVSLKGLHFFNFINWHPVSFLKKFESFDWSAFERWVILFLIIAVFTLLLMLIAQALFRLPPFSFSLILGLAIAMLIEWRILDLPLEWASLKKLSIPFIILIVTVMRFIVETARYMRMQTFR
ncbi:DNA helicase [Solibacillus silvestris]|uniref:DNA helicase n=1 Tax=Solibacillus silvestris TaxID=76853 RepID=UPI003F803F7E